MDFLNKADPVADIKERLYSRVRGLQIIVEMNEKIESSHAFEYGVLTGESNALKDEIEYYKDLIDIIERS